MNYDRKTKTELIAEIERLKALVDESRPSFNVQLKTEEFRADDVSDANELLNNFVETNPFMVEHGFYIGYVSNNSDNWSSSNC